MQGIIKDAPTGPITELEPGVYRNVPAFAYFALPYASQSTIKAVAQSIEKYLYKKNQDQANKSTKQIAEEEDTLYFGNWYHTYLLQHDDFDQFYVEGPAERRSNEDKETYRNLSKLYGSHQAVYRPRHLQKMKWMMNTFGGYTFPRDILLEEGESELTIIWDEEIVVDGEVVTIRCKGRIDRYNTHRQMGIDLKTTGKDTDKWFDQGFFRKPSENHVQGGFYNRGLNKCGLPCVGIFYFVQETKPPYQVRYKMVGADVLSRGWEDAEDYLVNYARFQKQGFQQLPCELLMLPDWMQRDD